MKRICLFAGYNLTGAVQEYVFDYLEELSRYADIHYMADGSLLGKSDIDRLLRYCKKVHLVQHGKYDFGSYSELSKHYVGWDIIEGYDELIFANDSCFCVQDFKKVFRKMDEKDCDAWGLLATDEQNFQYYYPLEEYLNIPSSKVPLFCMGTYFIAFRKNVISDAKFRKFVNSVQKESDRHQVCMKYEMGLTRFLKKNGYKMSAFIDVVYRNVVVYDEQGIRLLKRGFPLVKAKIFKENPLSVEDLDALRLLIISYVKNDRIDKYLSSMNISVIQNGSFDEDKWRLWIPPVLKKSKNEMLKFLIPPMLIFKYKQIEHRLKTKKSGDLALLKKTGYDHQMPDGEFIIYFNVAVDTIGGGMLSINRFIDRTITLFKGKDTTILLSGLPLNNPAVKYTMFEGRLQMLHLSDIVTAVSPEKLILHIPEFYLPDFIENLSGAQKKWLSSIPFLHINIMDQNHDYLPERGYFEHCKAYTDKVTITTAHEEYSTQEVSEEFDCPIKLLTPFLPEFYRNPHSKKEKLIAISPDEFIFDGVSRKDKTLKYLRDELPDYKIVVINDLTFEEYKQLISRSMFTITFGEGYDGYFIEPFLSDSVAFAVYNTTFFPAQFKDAPTVYSSLDDFLENIVADIIELENNEKMYSEYSAVTENMVKEVTNDERSIKNLVDFYDDKFEHVPEVCLRTGYYNINV